MTKTRLATIVLTAALAATSALAQDDEQRISRTFDVGENGELSLANVSGDIRIEGTSGNQITLEAVKSLRGRADSALLDEVEIDISHTGDRVRVETRYPRHGRRGRDRDRDHDHRGGHGCDRGRRCR